ncbi:MAG: hypothetical protein KGK07_07435 [Chloroflexota bacterium]|nr:hypothetical protein [Chloroflexota bacterium]
MQPADVRRLAVAVVGRAMADARGTDGTEESEEARAHPFDADGIEMWCEVLGVDPRELARALQHTRAGRFVVPELSTPAKGMRA